MCQVLVFATDDLTPGRPRLGEPLAVYPDGTVSAANDNLPNPNAKRPLRVIELPGVDPATWKSKYFRAKLVMEFSAQYQREIMRNVAKRNLFAFDFARDAKLAPTRLAGAARIDTVTEEEHDRMLVDDSDGKSVFEKRTR